MTVISVKSLIESEAHLGHTTRKWHPAMKEYIYAAHRGIHLIDARKTLTKLKEAYHFVARLGAKGGKVLFVGTKSQARSIIKEEAERCECFYVANRWLGGTLTNFSTIRQSITKLNQYDKLAGEDGAYPGILKKEAVKYEKLRQKMISNLQGIRHMRKAPGAIFVVDIRYEDIAVSEATKLGIPVIAIVDTNSNPGQVDYAIPGNDDSINSIRLFSSVLASGFLVGRETFEQRRESENTVVEKDSNGSKKDSKQKSESASPSPKQKPEERKEPATENAAAAEEPATENAAAAEEPATENATAPKEQEIPEPASSG